MKLRLPPVYPITDKLLAGKSSHLEIVRELARGGATLIQVRDKRTPLVELLEDLRRCVEFSSEYGICLLVNDRSDLALSAAADGVHLGQEDLPPEAARRLLGRRKIIGFSTHNLRQVHSAQSLPIDYIGFGPIFPTSTKENPSPLTGEARLRRACSLSTLPVVAIGGIGLDQLRPVLDAGATSAAVISALMRTRDLAKGMETFLRVARETG